VTAATADRIAGVSAVVAGLSWMGWAIANSRSHRALEISAPGSSLMHLGVTLTVAWNLLLIPAALRLHHSLCTPHRRFALFLTGSGIVSVSVWAIGALTRVTHSLEFIYLVLASIWLLGLAILMPAQHRRLARFTLLVGAFTALDAIFNRFEPMPFLLYALAAPKLPLSALWSVSVGVSLLSSRWSAILLFG